MNETVHVKFGQTKGGNVVSVGKKAIKHEEVCIEADTRFGEPILTIRIRMSDVVIHGEPGDGTDE